MSRFVIIGSDGFYTGEHYTNQGKDLRYLTKKFIEQKYTDR